MTKAQQIEAETAKRLDVPVADVHRAISLYFGAVRKFTSDDKEFRQVDMPNLGRFKRNHTDIMRRLLGITSKTQASNCIFHLKRSILEENPEVYKKIFRDYTEYAEKYSWKKDRKRPKRQDFSDYDSVEGYSGGFKIDLSNQPIG